ncbi:MAG TPA: hydroxymethylglutaryl-CoA lyase [Smithellaceae bacterium]|nr:hydroxymethylglutaryl-CoA lyase [Smithellaceae bacterium]MDD3258629.1 hydroxymethylglutaryl-CoA lyase [Smithellaceae bacterium]HPL10506.1 hydroxymethylglutaryl-CoA lyase [Smithellaceae bacterium]
MMKKIKIIEVGPRDGLQNLETFVPTDKKIALIKKLAGAGLKEIQIGSFVSPQSIAQFRDIEEVAKAVRRLRSVVPSALVPNRRGAEKALACGISRLIFFFSVSSKHNYANVKQSPQDSLKELKNICRTYTDLASTSIRVDLATAFGCPFAGNVTTAAVLRMVEKVAALGVQEITLCDTVGFGHPKAVEEKFRKCFRLFPEIRFGAHFHNTRGLAQANALRAWDIGIRSFDSSVGGLGGCPYAPGSSGNVATEDLVYLFESMGIKTGMDLKKLLNICAWLKQILPQAKLSGSLFQAGLPRTHKLSC